MAATEKFAWMVSSAIGWAIVIYLSSRNVTPFFGVVSIAAAWMIHCGIIGWGRTRIEFAREARSDNRCGRPDPEKDPDGHAYWALHDWDPDTHGCPMCGRTLDDSRNGILHCNSCGWPE